jgi:hypothetical protein
MTLNDVNRTFTVIEREDTGRYCRAYIVGDEVRSILHLNLVRYMAGVC